MLINSERGKFVKKGIMEPVGVCDRTGFWFSKSDLVKEQIWSGDQLIWNGLLVGRPFVDKPNEQLRTPIIKDDPHAVEYPRPAPYESQGVDAPLNKQRQKELETLDFTDTTPDINRDPNIHNIMGYDSSKIEPKTRENILNRLDFNN